MTEQLVAVEVHLWVEEQGVAFSKLAASNKAEQLVAVEVHLWVEEQGVAFSKLAASNKAEHYPCSHRPWIGTFQRL